MSHRAPSIRSRMTIVSSGIVLALSLVSAPVALAQEDGPDVTVQNLPGGHRGQGLRGSALVLLRGVRRPGGHLRPLGPGWHAAGRHRCPVAPRRLHPRHRGGQRGGRQPVGQRGRREARGHDVDGHRYRGPGALHRGSARSHGAGGDPGHGRDDDRHAHLGVHRRDHRHRRGDHPRARRGHALAHLLRARWRRRRRPARLPARLPARPRSRPAGCGAPTGRGANRDEASRPAIERRRPSRHPGRASSVWGLRLRRVGRCPWPCTPRRWDVLRPRRPAPWGSAGRDRGT